MKDDELEVWRRQWNSQPGVPVDLIRRVQRQTLSMRRDWISQIAPGLVGVSVVVAAAIMSGPTWTLLAAGTWVFILVGWWFMARNTKGVWAPAQETTSAYLDLSIERCRRSLSAFRFGNALALLLTTFVFVMDYLILYSSGGLETTSDYLVMLGAFLVAAVVVALVMARQARKRKETAAELEYLLNVRQQLKDPPRGA